MVYVGTLKNLNAANAHCKRAETWSGDNNHLARNLAELLAEMPAPGVAVANCNVEPDASAQTSWLTAQRGRNPVP
eukprot:11182425-Lingulodinium_polyedra.AAC.1